MSRYDEESVRSRPQRGNTRRRSKDRPDFSDAVIGLVTAVDRGRITCVHPVDVDHAQQTTVVAVKARELGRKAAVVGDRVRLVGDISGRLDTLARLVEIVERRSVLMRTADDTDPVERIIVANADQLAIVVAAADPEPRFGLIDRALVAAFDGGLEPILIITKADVGNAKTVAANYTGLDLQCLILDQTSGKGMKQVSQALAGRTTVLVGHSGVGKSTLVNALVPDALRATGDVNAVTGRGTHTSTSAVMLPLPNDSGWVIDTPGVRSFGLAHVDPDRIMASFPDLEPGTADCPRACTHVGADGGAPPDCALDAYVNTGQAGAAGSVRLDSLRRLLAALHSPST